MGGHHQRPQCCCSGTSKKRQANEEALGKHEKPVSFTATGFERPSDKEKHGKVMDMERVELLEKLFVDVMERC